MSSQKSIRIFFVEDSEVIRFAVKSMLRKVPDFEFIGEAHNGTSALSQLSELAPEVVLVDIGLPDINGIDVTKQLKALHPEVRVLMLTASSQKEDILSSLDAGADGYILKGHAGTLTEHGHRLESAIRSATLGSVWLDPAIAQIVLDSQPRTAAGPLPDSALSTQEITVLGQVAHSDCENGMCLVDPEFVKRLRRLSGPSVPQKDSKAPTKC